MQYFDCIPASGIVNSQDRIPARGEWKFVMCISTRRNAIFWLHPRKRNCQFQIVFPRGGMQPIFMCISANGTVNRNKYKISACGDVKFWLHSRQAELSILDRIPARGECKFLCASPLAGIRCTEIITKPPLAEMQPKYCIPASGGLLLFQFLSPLEEMHRKLCIPASGNAKRMLHLCSAEMQADVCSTARHKTV